MKSDQHWNYNYIVEHEIIRFQRENLHVGYIDYWENLKNKINFTKHRIIARKECLETLENLDGYMGSMGCAAEGEHVLIGNKIRTTVSGVMVMEGGSCYTEYLVKDIKEILPDNVTFRIIHWSWSQKREVILEEIKH